MSYLVWAVTMTDDLTRKRSERAYTGSSKQPGGDWGPAITSVDMTPRPRYKESQAAFETRMASYGVDMAVLRREVKVDNRNAALRSVEVAGVLQYFTQCNCGFCGLRVADPEVARREYDAHPCAAESVGQKAVDRAVAETNRTTLDRRTTAVLTPAIQAAVDAEVERRVAKIMDEAEARFALLELK